jgi:hypothetical protein
MTSNEHSGNGNRVKAVGAETSDYDGAGVANVARRDFLGGESLRNRDRAMEVIGVGGSEAGNGLAGLGPGGGEFGVGVNDAADLGEFAVKQGMGVEIAGGAERAFDNLALEIGDDQVGGCEGGVINATGLDDDERLRTRAIHTAGIAKGVRGETAAGDFLIGAENLVA